MSSIAETDLQIASLADSLDRVYRAFDAVAETGSGNVSAIHSHEPCFALHRLETIFGLSPFERDLLLLCVGAALESRFLFACAAANGDARATWPTLGLALSLLESPHWSAISRARPLRWWRLVDIESGSLLQSPLRIDERILQFVIGIPSIDERLESLIFPLDQPHESRNEASHHEHAISLAAHQWKHASGTHKPLLITASHSSSRRSFFTELCRRTDLQPWLIHAADIPTVAADREQLARLWTREALLSNAALLVQTDDTESLRPLSAWLRRIETPIAIEVQPGSIAERIDGFRVHLAPLSAQQRRDIWSAALGPVVDQINGHLERIVDHFHFDQSGIQLSASTARGEALTREVADRSVNPGEILWNICRGHARHSLDGLAQRVETRAGWDDLVLPPEQTETLRQIVVHVRRRAVVNDRWGFADRYERGLGLSALFTGGSGTGKTMAAEIIAADLDLDLYRIDLASVVSKYIGETEKNLRAIFDAAQESGAILLFDEADALFGKRSEVNDSHDRYANLEISYLLQRVESYCGVAILTTNMQHAMDPAFVRRIRFSVPFPFPDAPSRLRIWQRIFPQAAPLGELNFHQLAQLNVSGGIIRNIAIHAAFLAAEQGTRIEMRHMLAAARTEYIRMDKLLTAVETRGWL